MAERRLRAFEPGWCRATHAQAERLTGKHAVSGQARWDIHEAEPGTHTPSSPAAR
jgi:hypothetical protein